VILLVNNLRGWAAKLSRIGIGLFIVFYCALDSIMGIAGGLLIRSARELSSSIQIFAEKQFNLLLFDPFVGGSTFSVIGILGGGGWAIGVIAAAIALGKAGVPRLSVVLLIASGILFGLAHVPPTGPLGMACFFIAVEWRKTTPGTAVRMSETNDEANLQNFIPPDNHHYSQHNDPGLQPPANSNHLKSCPSRESLQSGLRKSKTRRL
jgi:hypothetical protein